MTFPPLTGLLPGIAALLGRPGPADRPGAGADGWLGDALDAAGRSRPDHVVLLLVDGLGARQLAEHAGCAPVLSGSVELGPLTSTFPSTTAVALTSLGTGLPPGMHGIVGSSFRLDDGTTLAPLTWGESPNPIATQPEPTFFERLSAAGVLVVSAAPSPFRASGLTRAGLRGGEYPGADSAAERVSVAARTLERARAEGRPSFSYVYWPDLDKAGHVYGVASPQYREELARVDTLVAGLADLAAPDVLVLVTADHGMVDVPDTRRFDLEANPQLRRGVVTILGEPRVRHVYTEPGRTDEVARTWAEVLGERATVLSRQQAEPLLGPIDEWHADRVGDLVVVAQEDWALVSDRVDRIVSGLRGQHAGLTQAELLVPLRALGG